MTEGFTITFEEGDDGWCIASIPEIPGAVSQGKTQDEARDMVIDCAKELMAFRREEALKADNLTKVERISLAG